MKDTSAREHPVLLEIMTRRWYRLHELTPFWSGVTRDGTAYITTSYEKNGTRRHLAAAFVDTQDLDDVAGAISRRAAEYPQDETVYLDLYAAAAGAGEELANRLREALERADIPLLVQRVVLDVPGARARRLRRRTRSRCGARSTAAGRSTATSSSCTRSWPSA